MLLVENSTRLYHKFWQQKKILLSMSNFQCSRSLSSLGLCRHLNILVMLPAVVGAADAAGNDSLILANSSEFVRKSLIIVLANKDYEELT